MLVHISSYATQFVPQSTREPAVGGSAEHKRKNRTSIPVIEIFLSVVIAFPEEMVS